MARVLAEQEERLVELLARSGIPRAAARCLVAMARGGTWTSSGLVRTCALSGASVSQGTTELESRALIARSIVRSGERGRPSHRFELAGSAQELLLGLESARRAELLAELEGLDALRALITRVV